MNIEIIVYLIIALILMSIRRIISGMKNGCFYGKNSKPLPDKLEPYIKNIHFLETPAWYSQFGAVFLFLFAIFRIINPEISFYIISIQLLASYMISMGSSAMASYHFQGYINNGAGLPFVDENENPKSEFAINLFGKKISFWWNRPWYGKRRRFTPFLGVLAIIIGFLIIKFLL